MSHRRASLRPVVGYKPILHQTLREAWAATHDAEVLIYHPKAVAGYHIRERLRIPGFLGLPYPIQVPTIEAAPHDWLFEHGAVVVHHGGAGTTAAGLRAGRPTVVCPFFGDQPFWGRRVYALGVGPVPIPQKRLTAESLAAAIRQAATDDTMRHRARDLGARIRQEDGIDNALAHIGSYLAAPA